MWVLLKLVHGMHQHKIASVSEISINPLECFNKGIALSSNSTALGKNQLVINSEISSHHFDDALNFTLNFTHHCIAIDITSIKRCK